MRFRITRLPNGQYLATSVDVPGLIGQGSNESEAVSVARPCSEHWTDATHWHLCTDPSHPPLFQYPGQKDLYRLVLEQIRTSADAGIPDADIVGSVSDKAIQLITQPNADLAEGSRVQGLRRRIAAEWGAVLHKVDNLAHLTKRFVLDCIREDKDQLTFVLCLLALESNRTVFATVNQLRGALAAETFGYWRTLYESYVVSQFLLMNSAQDPDLPGRFAHSTNSMYLDFFTKFAATDAESESESSWSKAEAYYKSHYPIEGKGNYGWAYPSISARRPNFRQIAMSLDADSKHLNEYYAFATSKTHGRFLLGFDGPHPTRVGSIGGDSFTTGGIGPVLEFTIPLYGTVLENACASSSAAPHQHVRAIVRMAIQDIGSDIATIKSEQADNYA